MSSEQLADGVNPLDAELAATWDVLKGYSGRDTDLGIARRFGDAAAAYSLRDIGAMNGSVVRVRREPNDTTAGIDDEERFSANQVQDGTLEKWVNGELESTLPADVATAAAAYSLRKVKASYSGNAVRIRRSSDNVEVDVAFDSDYKVSASSAITNVAEQGGESGQTTATDLNGFLNPTYTVGTSVESATRPFDSFTSNGNDGFTATNDATGSATAGFPYTFATGDVISVSFDLVIENSASPTFILSGNNMGSGSLGTGTTFTTSGSYTQEITTTSGTGTHLAFTDGNTGTFTVSNFRVTSHKAEAFVHTWYDQAGSNNAVQLTSSKQPQIASSGALLDGIKFNAAADGSSPDFLETDSKLGDTTDFFIATVIGEAQGQTAFGGIITSRSAADEGFAFGLNASEKAQAFIYSSAGNTNDTSDEIVGNRKRLLTLDVDSTVVNGSVNAVPSYSFTSNTMGSITEDKSLIGYGGRTDSVSDSLGLRANINELIFYNSDQASNRFLIESNINNYYKLYNDEYEWDDATNTEWQNDVTDGTTTFTANGKDGFTITATGENISSFKYAITSPSTASNNYYKVSFNVNDPDGLFDDAQLRLTATGSGATAQTITNGFNSLSLRTGASFEYMSINSDGGGSSKTATLSNFKISRIARNGFVETWYDQSGSGNDATQTTASQQPKIVENGGIVKNVKGFSSVKFEFTPRTELDIGLLISNLNSVSAYVVTQKDDGDTNVMAGFTQGVSSNNSRFYLPFYTGGTTPNLGYNDSASKISFGTTLTGTCNLYSVFSGDTNIEAFKNGSSVGTTALVDQAVTETSSKIGQLSNSFYLDGVISEIFLTTKKLQDDAATINSDVTSYYNL